MESTYCSGQGPYGRSQTAVTPVPHDLTLTSDSVALPMHMLHIHTCRKDVENRNKALFVFLYFSETGLHYVDDHIKGVCTTLRKINKPFFKINKINT